MSFENELGVTAPLGFFDPAGFTTDGDEEAFNRRRAVEIKHGRVAMLATIGYIVPDLFKLPGNISNSANLKFADIPNGLGAIKAVPALGWVQIILFIGLLELVIWPQQEDKAPGDIGGDNWVRYDDPEVKADKLNKELNNGRLAQMAIIGMWVQEGVTGQTPIQQITTGHISPFGDGQGAF
eukprot:CAMPEP_0171457180 /NCGR_PEP_ID=MMETSP0945-20130129/3362_1 /TAXON_ID=109269 /ORGANISM="Vaucheria litorea, Strain CCMP2940" /LENGTH=180 /DNA_ID=CAMNT_0011982737 /DNA_START=196 /DNA_END=738 /DNA_ORIENTATION=-